MAGKKSCALLWIKTSSSAHYLFSSGTDFSSATGDAMGLVQARRNLASVDFQQVLPEFGRDGGIATVTGGTITLANPQTPRGAYELDSLNAIDFCGSSWILYLAEVDSYGNGPSTLADWGSALLGGQIKCQSADTDQVRGRGGAETTRTIRLDVVDPWTDIVDERISIGRFKGYGNVPRMTASHSISFGDAYDSSGSLLWEFAYKLNTGDLTATDQDVMRKWDGATSGSSVVFNPTADANDILVSLFDLSTTAHQTTGDVLSEDALWHTCSVVYDKDAGRVAILIDGVVVKETLSVTGTISNVTDPLLFGNSTATLDIAWFRIWDGARSDSEILADHNRIISDTTPGLIAHVYFGSGTTWTASVGATDGTITGGDPFVHSGEGHEELAQRSLPLILGSALPIASGVLMDPGDWEFKFSDGFPGSGVDIAWQYGDRLTETTHYTEDPAAGSLKIISAIDGTQIESTRVSVAGTDSAIVNDEDLISELAFDSGIGPLAASRKASPFVEGGDLEHAAGIQIRSEVDPPYAEGLLTSLARGSGSAYVWVPGHPSNLKVIRTPPFPQPQGVVFEERADFRHRDIYVTAPAFDPTNEEIVQWGLHRAPLNADNLQQPTTGDQEELSDHSLHVAEWQRVSRIPEDPISHAIEGIPVPTYYVDEITAVQVARKRVISPLSDDVSRVWAVKPWRYRADAMTIGTHLWLIADSVGLDAGVPVMVAGHRWRGTGSWPEVLLMQLPYLRLAPDALEDSSGLSGTPKISTIADDPVAPDGLTESFNAAADQAIRISFPTPVRLAASKRIGFRVRFGVTELPTVKLQAWESGSLLTHMIPNIIGGTDEEPLLYGSFPVSDLADSTGAGLELYIEVGTGAGVDIDSADAVVPV